MKERRLRDLGEAVQHCNLCSRLCGRSKVLSEANGNVAASVLVVAEAPGRLGADRTNIPLFGDRTGDNFEELLRAASWTRRDIFATNAILCNPRDGNGNNSTPVTDEVRNCSRYLDMTINLVEPDIVVTLGATALLALSHIAPHALTLRRDVARLVPWAGRWVFPLYHPGPRALIHRSLDDQKADFGRLAEIVCGGRVSAAGKAPTAALVSERHARLAGVVSAILGHLGKMSYFQLTKLLYLSDYRAFRERGHTITGEIYLRQKDGPWLPALLDVMQQLDGTSVILRCPDGAQTVGPGPSPGAPMALDSTEVEVLVEVMRDYGRVGNSAIKTAAYQTSPMRYVLRQERKGQNMMRKMVLCRDRAIGVTDS